MSLYARDGANANSALLVGVSPADFGGDHPLAGVEFQRTWERKAFALGGRNYFAPLQLAGISWPTGRRRPWEIFSRLTVPAGVWPIWPIACPIM